MKLAPLFSPALVFSLSACNAEESTHPTSGSSGPSFLHASNTWTAKAAPPIGLTAISAAMAPNRAGQSMVYIFGGEDKDRAIGAPVLRYNVTTNRWVTLRSRVEVSRTNGAAKIGSRLYFSGGLRGGDASYATDLWAYDYTADRMNRKAAMPKFTGDGVSAVIDGKLYVLPGTCSTEDGSCATEPIRQLYRYDPATNGWVTRRQAPHFHKNGAAGVIDGKLYVAGGLSSRTPVTALDVYDPVTNSWRTLAPLPVGGRAIGAVLGGKFYVITARMYAYDPRTNSWQVKASPRWTHAALVRVVSRGVNSLLAVGGTHGTHNEIPSPAELYRP